jgi:hypothetical protein
MNQEVSRKKAGKSFFLYTFIFYFISINSVRQNTFYNDCPEKVRVSILCLFNIKNSFHLFFLFYYNIKMSNIDEEIDDEVYSQAMKEKAMSSLTIDQLWLQKKAEEEEEKDDVPPRRVPENDTKYMEAMKKRAAEEARKNAEEEEEEEKDDDGIPRTYSYDPKLMEAMKKRAAKEEDEVDDKAPPRIYSTNLWSKTKKTETVADEEEEKDTRFVKTSDFNQPRKWWPSETQQVPAATEKASAQSTSMDEKCKQVIGKMRSLTSKYEADLAALQSELGAHNGGRRSRKILRRQKKRVSKK